MQTQALTVLIVDDDPLIALDIEDAVTRLGFLATPTAASFAASVAIAERYRPHIALIDGHLADGPTGRRVAEHMHAQGIYCIAMTANPEVFEGCGCIGVFVSKPFDNRKLHDALLRAAAALTMPPTALGDETSSLVV